ncbi:GspH/FimT family pseudopilin [Hydrogenophaga defluvii]|uniref:GspH/FimT family pseudopilin n=1 Tax=Hydrogenophaga defluvii TaxID=249410 RepID=UPI0036D3A24F
MVLNRQNTRGFTLVELMVTTSIAAVMLAIAAPSLRDFVQRSQLSSAANDLSLALMYARSEAIKRGWPVTVCKSANPSASSPACSSAANWQTGWVVFVNHSGMTDAATSSVDAGTPADEVIRVGSGLSASVSGGTGFGNYITFLPAGAVKGSGNSGSAASGAFTVTVASLAKQVCINTTGRSEVTSGSCP